VSTAQAASTQNKKMYGAAKSPQKTNTQQSLSETNSAISMNI